VTAAPAQAADGPAGSPGEADWEAPPRTAAATGAPVLSADGFEAPLDWLLEMARAQKLDLARLPIAGLVKCFAEALDLALARRDGQAPNLSRWGDWLVMAATLTQVWSRLLLPVDAPEAKAALTEAEALRRQLIDLNQIRAAADWLKRGPQLGRQVFPRGRPELPAASRGADIADLLRACLSLLRVPKELAASYQPRPPPFRRVSQAIARIEAMLLEQPDGAALTAFLPAIAVELPDREGQSTWSRSARRRRSKPRNGGA
jgi:segregation and condensation protein A